MNHNQHISIRIHRSEIFKNLTNKQYTDLLQRGRRIKLQPKSVLFHQGDSATHCFLVNQGLLKLTKLNEQGKEVILRYIRTGELTAAVTALKNWNYPVSAESIGETDVTGWDKSTMMQLMHQYPDITINLLGIILERIDDVQHRYLEICTEQVDQRIARSLLRLMRRAGSKSPDGIQIDIPLSRQNIADYSGTTLYTVSRTLSAWEKRGWIKSKREQIIVTEPHALVQFAETG
ncbi:MAG: Crp/Fnr family transcriptional regulator [Desulfobacterales bacterium]